MKCKKCGREHRTKRGGPACTGHLSGRFPYEPCTQPPMRGMNVCPSHGGRSLRGAGHPKFKAGGRLNKFSNVLPRRYAERVERLMLDPHYLELRSHIAVVDARIMAQFERLERSGESGAAWEAAQRSLAEMREALAAMLDSLGVAGSPELDSAVDTLGAAVERGAGEEKIWRECLETLEQRRKLSETDAKRIERERAYLTAEQALVLTSQLAEIVADGFNRLVKEVAEAVGFDPANDEARKARNRVMSGVELQFKALGHQGPPLEEPGEVAN